MTWNIPGMPDIRYRNRSLMCEDTSIEAITGLVGTPCYIYSSAAITRNVEAYQEAFRDQRHQICYALKANANLAIICHLDQLGAGFDAVSGGEIAKALAAGAKPETIVFAGVGKTRTEMREALAVGIRQFNVESIPELMVLNEVAADLGVTAPVALRVNPDVDPHTHQKISTGLSENKFGIAFAGVPEAWRTARDLDHVRLQGVALHIGSQILSLEPYRLAFARTAALVRQLREEGAVIKDLDVGGGIGVAYRSETDRPPKLADYARLVKETLGDLDCEILLEPGRSILGTAGILVASVLYVKEGADRRFLILDAAMNDLLRPAMYDAWHDLIPLQEPCPDDEDSPCDIVGPICESSDTFAQNRLLPPLEATAQVAFLNAGAYGASMASEYNCRPLVPEVLVNRDTWSLIRARGTVEDMIRQDFIPDWLAPPPSPFPT